MNNTHNKLATLSHYSNRQRAFEGVFLAAFVICSVAFTLKIYQNFAVGFIALFAIGLLLGMIAADFVAGTVHWAADTWGTVEWPVIGRTLIRSFREHHVDPRAITRHDFIETNGASSMLCLPILISGLSLPLDSGADFFLATFILIFSIFILLTNQIHKWAHELHAPKIVSFFQNSGLIMSSAHHKIHHDGLFDQHYCITTGWLNPLLTKISFYRRLERVISKLTGAVPRADDAAQLGFIKPFKQQLE